MTRKKKQLLRNIGMKVGRCIWRKRTEKDIIKGSRAPGHFVSELKYLLEYECWRLWGYGNGLKCMVTSIQFST